MPARNLFIVLFLSLSFYLFALSSPLASHAQTNSSPTIDQFTHRSLGEDGHVKVQTMLIDILAAIHCQLTGVDLVHPKEGCMTIDLQRGGLSRTPPPTDGRAQGAIGQMAGLIGYSYQLPIHTSDYTNYLAQNFGVTERTFAAVAVPPPGGGPTTIPAPPPDTQDQGSGFTNLQPMLKLWTKVRDLTYMIFVVIFVLIGLGIMLRVKIDPRTVMTVQNQIPKIIISILLITFSYAIAGLLIDTMWVSTYLGINILTDASDCANLPQKATTNLLNTPMSYVSQLFADNGCKDGTWGITRLAYDTGQAMGDIIATVIGSLFTDQSIDSNSCGLADIATQGFWTTAGQCINGVVFSIFSGIAGFAVFLIIDIAILVQLFKLWFGLLKSFVYVLMYTVLSPIWILLGLIPGTTNFGFEQWLRDIASALSVFPATAFIFISAAIVAYSPEVNAPAGGFAPPLIGNPALPDGLGKLIALGAILIAPEIVEIMRAAFKTKPSPHTQQVFAGLGAGAALAGGAVGKPLSYLTRRADITRGDAGGALRQALQGGAAPKAGDMARTDLRYKAVNFLLGMGRK